MPPGWKLCRRALRTAPPPRRCRRSATSTSLNSRRSFRPVASAEIDPRDVRSAPEPALQEPRLTDQPRLHLTEPRSPRLRNPDQLRRGKRYRPSPSQGGSILDADLECAPGDGQIGE